MRVVEFGSHEKRNWRVDVSSGWHAGQVACIIGACVSAKLQRGVFQGSGTGTGVTFNRVSRPPGAATLPVPGQVTGYSSISSSVMWVIIVATPEDCEEE